MNADAEFDAPLGRDPGVALDQAVLHLDRAAHCVDHAAKLDKDAVAGALDDTAVMDGDGGVDQIAAQPPEPRKGTVFVRAGEPAVADNVRDQDRRKFPGLAHGGPQATRTLAQRPATIGRSGPVVRPWGRDPREGSMRPHGLLVGLADGGPRGLLMGGLAHRPDLAPAPF